MNNKVDKLVNELNFAQKIERALDIISDAYKIYGRNLVVANSLGKDSSVIWHLAQRIDPHIRGFIVSTRFKPKETLEFMSKELRRCPNFSLKVYRNEVKLADKLYERDPNLCCALLKVEPTQRALYEMEAEGWITGLRSTEGLQRSNFQEMEKPDNGLQKLNPILIWTEREVWQYLALHQIPVNPLYLKGYRSLGCEPCTRISTEENERSGRWVGTNKCGGECGIHSNSMNIIGHKEKK